ncbi:uncharacterized protein Bfra_001556 [Botrytis fragariae]|uniref:Uncharacterized protein n=1 Tax=Botrytis fragariae TaxID=1964551 RepID=A0A8H6B0J4_9HELO|nr:uncharacterized protein Bfra_001556 [Botrytis fragariae]KAF5877193.1 hypothetical protein Bfra_001556 [Botrytis fragariae]
MNRTLSNVRSGYLRLHTEGGTVIRKQVQEWPPENAQSSPVPNPISFNSNSCVCGRRFQIYSCSTKAEWPSFPARKSF